MRLSSYIVLMLVVSSVYSGYYSPMIGVTYFVATLPLIAFTMVSRDKNFLIKSTMMLGCVSIYAMYFVRAAFLTWQPQMFGFSTFGDLTDSLVIETLLLTGVYSAATLFGLYLGVASYWSRTSRPNLSHNRFSLSQVGDRYLLILLAMSVLWLVLVTFFDVGVKKADSRVELLRLVLPSMVLLPAAIGFFGVAIIRKISTREMLLATTVIAVMIIATFLRGSKEALFLLLLNLFVLLVIVKGDLKVGLLRAGVYILGIPVAVIMAVLAANSIRYHGVAGLADVFDQVALASDFIVYIVDRITIRLNGLDGLLVVLIDRPTELDGAFSWGHILTVAAAKLFPGVGFAGYPIGKAVGIYYGGFDADAQFAGALGLFGTFVFMYGKWGAIIATFLFGYLFGFILRKMACLRIGVLEKIVLMLIFSNQIAHWLNAGNLDTQLQSLIINVIHLCFYYVVIRLIISLFSRKRDREKAGSLEKEIRSARHHPNI